MAQVGLSAVVHLVEQTSNLAVEGVLLAVCHFDARLGLQQYGFCLLRLLPDAQEELREGQIRPERAVESGNGARVV